MSQIRRLLLCGAALCVTGSPAPAQTPPSCSVTFLGPASTVGAMNELGTVVGQRSVGNNTRGWVASAGSPAILLPLPTPADNSSWALDLNELGVIVGAVSTTSSPEFSPRAARWTPDGMGGYTVVELGKLPGHSGSAATAINNLGDIVGYSTISFFRYPVLFSAPGGVLDLNPLGVFDPQAVNDQREMLDKQCKRLDLATMLVQSFPLPSGPPSYSAITGYAINELGQIAGTAVLATSTSCVYQAARHMDDYGWQLLSPCSPVALAYDINDLGDTLFKAFSTLTTIVHLEGIGDFNPQQLIAPGAGSFTVHGTSAINDARQLAVFVTDNSTGTSGAALLTPIQTCQADLGFGGPGTTHLAVCGGDLSSGTSANLILWGGPEAGTAWLIAGFGAAPLAWMGGTLVPIPFLLLPVQTGPTGTTVLPVPGGVGSVSVFLQAVHADATLPVGVGLSNAVRVDFLP